LFFKNVKIKKALFYYAHIAQCFAKPTLAFTRQRLELTGVRLGVSITKFQPGKAGKAGIQSGRLLTWMGIDGLHRRG
jgi:hypothetical protein